MLQTPHLCKIHLQASLSFGKGSCLISSSSDCSVFSAGKSWGNGLIRFTNGRALVVFAYLTQSEHAS